MSLDNRLGSYMGRQQMNTEAGNNLGSAGDWVPYEHMLQELQARVDEDSSRPFTSQAGAAAEPAEAKGVKRR